MSDLTEKEIRAEIKEYLQRLRWFVFPITQRYMSYKGISDFIACKNGVVLFIEAKTKRGKLRPDQEKFGKNILDRGCHYFVARGWQDVRGYIRAIEND